MIGCIAESFRASLEDGLSSPFSGSSARIRFRASGEGPGFRMPSRIAWKPDGGIPMKSSKTRDATGPKPCADADRTITTAKLSDILHGIFAKRSGMADRSRSREDKSFGSVRKILRKFLG